MSYRDLCDALPSQSSVEFVQYYKDNNLVSCTWEEFAEVAKDVVGKLALGIKVVADGWWVQNYSCGDSYYSKWQVHWVPEDDVENCVPEIKACEETR